MKKGGNINEVLLQADNKKLEGLLEIIERLNNTIQDTCIKEGENNVIIGDEAQKYISEEISKYRDEIIALRIPNTAELTAKMSAASNMLFDMTTPDKMKNEHLNEMVAVYNKFSDTISKQLGQDNPLNAYQQDDQWKLRKKERLDILLDMISNLHKSIYSEDYVNDNKEGTLYFFNNLFPSHVSNGHTMRKYIEQIDALRIEDTKALLDAMLVVRKGFYNGDPSEKLSPQIKAIADECAQLSKAVSKKLR